MTDFSKKIRPHLRSIFLAVVIISIFWAAGTFLQGRQGEIRSIDDGPEADRAGFYRDCVESVLKNENVPPSCATAEAILSAYKLDVFVEFNADISRMVMTARRIARGEMIDEKTYKECLKSGECVPVPQMSGRLDPDGERARQIRRDFWNLAERSLITKSVCSYSELCRALEKSGIFVPMMDEES